MSLKSCLIVVAVFATTVGYSLTSSAHCDTLIGPVVTEARQALVTNNVTPVLKWLKESDEAEVRQAFHRTMDVRGLSPEARELADRFFFETIVRLHRQGEGEPYTGLKDGTEIDDVTEGADTALDTGVIEPLVTLVTDRVAAGVRERFERVRTLKPHADDSVAAGRRYVEAYVDFIRYIEALSGHGSVQEGTAKAVAAAR